MSVGAQDCSTKEKQIRCVSEDNFHFLSFDANVGAHLNCFSNANPNTPDILI